MAVYFFYGEEDFNIDTEIKKLKNSLDKNYIEMSYKIFDNPSFPDLIAAIRIQPMMFGKMLIVIKCLEYFSKTFDDNEISEISSALEHNEDNVDIVFVAKLPRNEGKKLDSRKKLFKLLSKFNARQFDVIPTYKTAELEMVIKKIAQSKKLKITQDGITALISQIGNNLRQIDNELEKLRTVTYPENLVNAGIVRDNCISNEDLFAFSDYLLSGQIDMAILQQHHLLLNLPK